MLDDQLLDRVMAEAYNAAAGRMGWERVLQSIGDAVGARFAQLVGLSPCGNLLFSHLAGATPAAAEAHQAYLQQYHRLDPRQHWLRQAGAARWQHCHERLSDAQAAADPFFLNFLRPRGARWISGLALIADEQQTVLLGLARDKAPLPTQAQDWLQRLGEHLAEAVQIHRHLQREQQHAQASQLLLDSLPNALLLLDARGRLHYRNRAAKALLDEGQALLRRGNQLGCRHSDDEEALRATLAALLLGKGGNGRLRARRADGGAPLGLSLSRLPGGLQLDGVATEGLALLLVQDSGRLAQPDAELIAEVFGLSPAETEVALHLCEGLDAEAIAAQREVSLGTVRSQLRSLLAKTGTSRQVDLVRRLLALERRLPTG